MGSWVFLGEHEASHIMLLLTDGSILSQSVESLNWSRFRPDENSDYSRGRWDAPSPGARAFDTRGSLVLADGRVFVPDLVEAHMFDPVTDLWEMIRPDARLEVGFGGRRQIGSSLCVLSDGRVLIELRDPSGPTAALYDPASNAWTQVSNPLGYSSGRGVLLPNGSVLTVRHGATLGLQLYWPDRNEWSNAGDIHVRPEIGPLLPDGRVLVVTDRIEFFTPPATLSTTGVFHTGPEFPGRDSHGWPLRGMGRAECLLPSGRVLYSTRYADPASLGRRGTSYNLVFQEFDPVSSVFHLQEHPRFIYTSSDVHGIDHVATAVTLLPTGQVLVNIGGRRDINLYAVYSPDETTINDLWRPRITDCAVSGLDPHYTREIEGVRFNGLSQAVTSNATNYPIVQLRRTLTGRPGQRWYCRTFGHSSMGVATGERLVRTRIALPPSTPLGQIQIRVIVNGIASAWCDTHVYNPYALTDPLIPQMWNQLIGNLADGPLLIIGPNGIQPVPPWDPHAEQIKAAYKQIHQGLKKLEELGGRISKANMNERLQSSPLEKNDDAGSD